MSTSETNLRFASNKPMNAEKIASEASMSLKEFGIAISKLKINEPMKNVIEQIRKIKGVVTVEKAGENMAVVVFEPKPKDNGWHVSKIFIDDLKPMSEETAKKLLDVFKPKSLTPEELVDGRIYVDQYSKDWCNIFRFHDQQSRVYSILNTDNGLYSGHSSCYLSYSDMIRHATPSEAQTLIRAEVEHDFFFELK